uniref:Protein lin-15B n=1 Tax=Lygus hesperus TaxID=30085 RepID=A0A0A9ZAK2_LYGHE
MESTGHGGAGKRWGEWPVAVNVVAPPSQTPPWRGRPQVSGRLEVMEKIRNNDVNYQKKTAVLTAMYIEMGKRLSDEEFMKEDAEEANDRKRSSFDISETKTVN